MLLQVVAVRNTSQESLEITRWVDTNETDTERVKKEMRALIDRLYPKLSRDDRKKRKEAMTAVGESNEVLEVPPGVVKKLTNKIHYALYGGHCLDPKKLSYFLPEDTIEEGELSLEEAKGILSKK